MAEEVKAEAVPEIASAPEAELAPEVVPAVVKDEQPIADAK